MVLRNQILGIRLIVYHIQIPIFRILRAFNCIALLHGHLSGGGDNVRAASDNSLHDTSSDCHGSNMFPPFSDIHTGTPNPVRRLFSW